jgi:uncharacterized phosphatase
LRFPNGAVPGLESREALAARAVNSLSSIARRHRGQRVIVVAHGGVINAILASLTSGAIGSGKTKLENACINILELHEHTWMIERYNWTGHLTAAVIDEG